MFNDKDTVTFIKVFDLLKAAQTEAWSFTDEDAKFTALTLIADCIYDLRQFENEEEKEGDPDEGIL